MQNSTLIDILKTFNKDEFKSLEDLVRSLYYNKNSNITNLFLQLKKFYPSFEDSKLVREAVWESVFPGRKYNYGVMKNLIFGLQKLCEKYIELKEYEKNYFEQKINLSDGFLNRDLISLFEKNIKVVRSDLNKSKLDANIFYYKYMIESKEQDYYYHHSKSKEPGYCKPIPASESLTAFFLMRLLGSNYNAVLHSGFYNKELNTEYLQNAIRFFGDSLANENDAVKMYYYGLKTLLDKEDDESFRELKALIKKRLKDFDSRLSFNGCMSLINYCSYHTMKGNLNYLRDQFEIYKLMIDNSIIYGDETKFIDKNMFVNIVSSASNAGEFEWTENFIKNFSDKIHPAFRNQFVTLSNVIINIKKKNFESALTYLANAESKEFIEKINIKRFQIMIYYELNYIDELYSFIDSSKHFISNDSKTSEAVKTAFHNFIALVLKLMSYKSKPRFENIVYELGLLRKEIESTESPNKMWLLEKTSELEAVSS